MYIPEDIGRYLLASTGKCQLLSAGNTGYVFAAGSNGILQFLVSLIVLILVIVLCYFTTKFIANYQKNTIGKGNIEIVEAKNLGNNKFVEIVRIGEQYYALGVSKDNISLIDKVDKDSLSYQMSEKKPVGESFHQIMEKLRDKKSKDK